MVHLEKLCWKSKVDDRVVATWETVSMIWADVHRLLGRKYEGPQDDGVIISRLKELGIAPSWLDEEGVEVMAETYGWTAMSPEWPV